MSLFLEKWAPYVLGFAAALVWVKFDIALPKGDGILSSSLTIASILTGFLATAKAILLSLDTPVMKRLRSQTYFDDLVSYMSQSIWLSFGFSILCLVGYFDTTVQNYYGVVWISVGVTCAGAFVRVTNIMLKILRRSHESE